MASQTHCETRASVSPAPPTQTHRVSYLPIREGPPSHKLNDAGPPSRPRLAHTLSAPTSFNHTSSLSNTHNTSAPGSQRHNAVASESAAPTGEPQWPAAARSYTAHLPHNPSRPPPYTYQRQHEFPPFPPLAQHPVLPFLTTAFSEQLDTQPTPPKCRQTIAPRTSTTQRHVQSNVSMIPTMDVTKLDPNATFIRPPFVVPLPPNADNCVGPTALSGISTDGEPVPGTPLTYAMFHAHRDWFLDADDFRKDNPNRIDYPPELEPPRGWAPLFERASETPKCKQAREANEKTNRTKGSYAQAGNIPNDKTVPYGPSDDRHEKTVLRCTFCRREYHGPNAKSMWRRHVYDKHKVAMKNRREGSAGMAPKASFPKKEKQAIDAESSPGISSLDAQASLDTSALTLDLTNEQNLIRLLERVVSGNLEISLPASLLNSRSSDESTPRLNLQSIALALQKSGISLALEKGITQTSTSDKPRGERHAGDDQRKGESTDVGSVKPSASSPFGVTEYHQSSPPHLSLVAETVMQANPTESSPNSSMSPEHMAPRHSIIASSSQSDDAFLGRKPHAEAADHDGYVNAPGRAPLKDNTALNRNNHNSDTRIIPGTPRKDKGKQRALPRTPGASKVSHAISPISSPSSRNPYTPTRHLSSTALRSRTLATTGQESYLTLVLSSPDASSPIRNTGRVSFTSPFSRRTSHMRDKDKDCDPASDDALRVLGTSSPRYSFDFNIVGTQGSSYLSAFDPIPIEVATLSPTPWISPALGPPVPLSEPTSRAMSRASSVRNDADIDEDEEANEDNQELQLEYPEWSPPNLLPRPRPSHGNKPQDEDFDMEAFLDLEDAGPASSISLPSSPHKVVVSRGFSKEFGLLSPEEVDRITASARPTFEDEARDSKRRKVDGSS